MIKRERSTEPGDVVLAKCPNCKTVMQIGEYADWCSKCGCVYRFNKNSTDRKRK